MTTTDVVLRPATEEDLFGAYAVAWRCDHGVDAEVPTEAWRYRYLLHELRTGRLVVAVGDDGVVAMGGAIVRGGVAMLADLFVDPMWHGRGIGGSLLRAVLGDVWPRQTFSSAHPSALPLYIREGMPPRWLSLYLRGAPGAVASTADTGADVGVSTDAEPSELAALEASWGAAPRAEDHAYWSLATEAIPLQVHHGATPFGFAYLARDGSHGSSWSLAAMAVAPETGSADVVAALQAVLEVAVERGIDPIHAVVPGTHPSLRALLRAGWVVEDRDIYCGSAAGLLDPERRILDPTFA